MYIFSHIYIYRAWGVALTKRVLIYGGTGHKRECHGKARGEVYGQGSRITRLTNIYAITN